MIMTMHDKLVYVNSTLCHICIEELGKDRVLSGKFRGAAHEICNLKTRFQISSQLYITTRQAIIVTYLLKHYEIAKKIFPVFQIMKKTTFLSRNRLSLTNL